ncbi:hypothetical protein H0H81_011914 [Sphagnurus paluster]|uniref:Deacetylase sirtuin-type domain-containing protein n=1 Tax=Sphagnurus paluster TaxID=117069 RepID=A0A9P7FYA0_9AGAR|nr:hypothetical protein H0H81_011914 [Sphagnurus paluster]
MDSVHDRENFETKGYQPPTDNDILVLQVRAFLEAAEDVDIDMDTLEDLMQVIESENSPDLDPVGGAESESEDCRTVEDAVDGENGWTRDGDSDFEVDSDVLYKLDDEGVSCGIPDFRSRDGLYASLKDRGQYDLDDPQQIQRVALCTTCNPVGPSIKSKKKRGKKKSKGEWDSNDEDESDGPAYPPGIMKPDITFFGEKLTDEFDQSLAEDREHVDLLLIIGTSLKIVLLGNADEIVQYLCAGLGWDLPVPNPNPRLEQAKEEQEANPIPPPQRVGESHVWLFPGAEGGRWLQELERELQLSAVPTPQWLSPSPLVIDSGNSTPAPAERKRERGDGDVENKAEERALKKVRAGRRAK